MNGQQLRILNLIYSTGEAMDFRVIAEKTGLAPGTVLGVFRQLEAHGLAYELEWADGVYAISTKGILEIEAYNGPGYG